MNITTKFIFDTAGMPNDIKKQEQNTLCCFCGAAIAEGHRLKDVVSSGFTNWDLVINNSGMVCEACAFCLTYRYLRMSNWVVSKEGGLQLLKRESIATVLFNPPEPPLVMAVTYSFKKHLAIRSRLSYSQEKFHIRIEDKECWFEPAKWQVVWNIMSGFYSIPESEKEKKQPKTWFTKEQILTGNYQLYRIQQFGLLEWEEKEQILKRYRGQVAFELLVYALNRGE